MSLQKSHEVFKIIRLMIVDEDPIVRSALNLHLSQAQDVEIVANVPSIEEATRRILSRGDVDIALVDVEMPRKTGLQLAAWAESNPRCQTRVMLMAASDSDELIEGALESSARGLILKSASLSAMLETIRAVYHDGIVFNGIPGSRLVKFFRSKASLKVNLSKRELEVLKLLCKGYSNALIARTIHLSESRVKAHVSSLIAKFDVDSRLGVVTRAFEQGIVP